MRTAGISVLQHCYRHFSPREKKVSAPLLFFDYLPSICGCELLHSGNAFLLKTRDHSAMRLAPWKSDEKSVQSSLDSFKSSYFFTERCSGGVLFLESTRNILSATNCSMGTMNCGTVTTAHTSLHVQHFYYQFLELRTITCLKLKGLVGGNVRFLGIALSLQSV